jgi:preprotein translocase subunit YajC
MDFLISNAYAQGAQQADPFGFLLPMAIIFGAFYFLLIRPQQKKQKAHTALIAALEVGNEVMTSSGILGRITGVSEHYVIVQVSDNTELKMQRSSISQVVPKGTYDQA